MSYDLAVFHADAAPRDAASFLDWYRRQVAAAPREARPALHSWCRDMKERTGPFDQHATQDLVCANFSWDMAADVFHMAFELAGQHQVGLFNPRENLRWLPKGGGGLYQWDAKQAQGGTSSDALAVASAFLDALVESGDLEPEPGADLDDLGQRIAALLDRVRRRSPIADLWQLFMRHDAVGEVYLDKEELKPYLDRASESVLGHPPSSDTGWV